MNSSSTEKDVENEIATEKWKCDENQHLENEQKLEMGKKAAFWTKQQKNGGWFPSFEQFKWERRLRPRKCACEWGNLQMNVCYFPGCMQVHFLKEPFFWITGIHYLHNLPPISPLQTVIIVVNFSQSVSVFCSAQRNTIPFPGYFYCIIGLPPMYNWQMMPKSYLTIFPLPHLKKVVPKLSNLTYSDLHGFCSCAQSSSAKQQQQ